MSEEKKEFKKVTIYKKDGGEPIQFITYDTEVSIPIWYAMSDNPTVFRDTDIDGTLHGIHGNNISSYMIEPYIEPSYFFSGNFSNVPLADKKK